LRIIAVERFLGPDHIAMRSVTSPPLQGRGAGVGCCRAGSMLARKLLKRHRAASFATHPLPPPLKGRGDIAFDAVGVELLQTLDHQSAAGELAAVNLAHGHDSRKRA